jgi:hypothetical protein
VKTLNVVDTSANGIQNFVEVAFFAYFPSSMKNEHAVWTDVMVDLKIASFSPDATMSIQLTYINIDDIQSVKLCEALATITLSVECLLPSMKSGLVMI